MSSIIINVEEDVENGVVIVSPFGRLDTGQVERFDSVLKTRLQAGARNVVIDFVSTVFIASSGLRVILLMHKALSAAGGMLVLCGMSRDLGRVFRISGFHKVFVIEETREQAVAVARPPRYVAPERPERREPEPAFQPDSVPGIGSPVVQGAVGSSVPPDVHADSGYEPQADLGGDSRSGGRYRQRSPAGASRRRRSDRRESIVIDPDLEGVGFFRRLLIRILRRLVG